VTAGLDLSRIDSVAAVDWPQFPSYCKCASLICLVQKQNEGKPQMYGGEPSIVPLLF